MLRHLSFIHILKRYGKLHMYNERVTIILQFELDLSGFVIVLAEICQPPCVNGMCNVSTGYCDCDPGFTGLSCSEGEVVAV